MKRAKTVGELIEVLSTFDPRASILAYDRDGMGVVEVRDLFAGPALKVTRDNGA